MVKNEPIRVDYPIFADMEESPLDRLKRVDQTTATEYLRTLPYNYAQSPWLYFIRDGDFLKCLGSNLSIPCHGGYIDPKEISSIEKIYPQLFSVLPRAGPVYEEIGIALKGKKFNSYYHALMSFKREADLFSFPLFDSSDHIKVRDGRLFGWVHDKKQPCWRLLTDHVVNEEIKRYGGHEFKRDVPKKNLAKELLKFHSEQNAQDENPGQIVLNTPYFRLSYSPLLNQAEISRHNNFRFRIQRPSPDLRNFLRSLTGGDQQRLDDFAELLARLYRPSLPSKYLWGIVGNTSQINNFLQLVRDLGAYRPGAAIYEVNSTKALTSFINGQVNGCNVQINPQIGSSLSFKDVNRSRLIKFAAGEAIGSLDDPYIVKDEVVGKGVLMYAALELSEDCMGRLPHKIIHLPGNLPPFPQKGTDQDWMETCLLCHGLHLLTAPEAEFSSVTISLDRALRKFANVFCKPREGSWTDRKQFYEQFKRYCDTCVAVEGKIPGSTTFANYVEKELCWTSRAVRNNKNRMAFDGIFMDEEQIERTIQEASKGRAVQNGPNAFDFDAYIDRFSEYLHLPNNTC